MSTLLRDPTRLHHGQIILPMANITQLFLTQAAELAIT